MASLASLNRKAMKLAGILSRDSKRAIAARAAQAVADSAAQSERIAAMRAHLDASPAACAWHAWAVARYTARAAGNLAVVGADVARARAAGALPYPQAVPEMERAAQARADRAHARYLLYTACGVQEARAQARAETEADWTDMDTVTDDPAEAHERAARATAIRRAEKRAKADALARVQESGEPECPSIDRRAAAMLAILTDAILVASLPSSIRAQALLPEALLSANMLLPAASQASPETLRGE